MADFKRQDDENLAFIKAKLDDIEKGIVVPNSAKAAHLLQRSRQQVLTVVKTPIKWQRYTGIAAAFFIVLGSVLFLSRFGGQPLNSAPAAEQAAPSAAAFSADTRMMSAPAADEPAVAFASDYSELRAAMKAADTEPAPRAKKEEKEASSGNADPDTGGDGSVNPDTAGGGGEVYTTNAQTANIDEGDLVKTDGESIFVLRTPNSAKQEEALPMEIKIVDAKSLTLSSTITLPEEIYASDLYLSEDKLAVLYGNYSFSIQPRYTLYDTGWEQTGTRDIPAASLVIYDVSDTAKPVKEREFEQQGSYVSSRMTDGVLYLVSNCRTGNSPYYDGAADETFAPLLRDSAVNKEKFTLPASDIYIPDKVTSTSLTVVSAVSLAEPASVVTKAVLGGGSTVYMSPQNLYVAGWDSDEYTRESTTTLLKFGTANGGLEALAQGSVAGAIDGQFSLDEGPSGELRIATTRDYYTDPAAAKAQREKTAAENKKFQAERNAWKDAFAKAEAEGRGEEFKAANPSPKRKKTAVSSGDPVLDSGKPPDPLRRTMNNNLYVLDSSLNPLGAVEGLAPDERIYSVRYIGDIAYLVTFKQVDPLFAIDLSDPAHPKVLGQLKVPGFSEYLHPIGSDTLLGLGYNTQTTPEGNVTTHGLKLSLFDVSNPLSPTETQVYQLSGRYSESQALYTHQAFMSYDAKNIYGVPIRIYTETGDDINLSFEGLYLFHITPEKIELLGKLAQSKDITGSELYNTETYLERGIYLGDSVYLLSSSGITAYSLTTLEETAVLMF